MHQSPFKKSLQIPDTQEACNTSSYGFGHPILVPMIRPAKKCCSPHPPRSQLKPMHPVLVGLWPGVHQRDLEPQWDEWEEARCISTVADVAVLPSQKQQRTTTLHTSIGIFQILSQEVEKLTSGLWLELSWNHLKNPNQTKMRFFFTCLDCMASLVPTKIPSRSPGLEEITWDRKSVV